MAYGLESGEEGWFEVLEVAPAGPFSEAEELELAYELLGVSNEEELDQFLGKVFSGVWKGIKKVGSTVGKALKPLGGVLKGVAKAALPFVGGALGSFIPIPGVGTAVGSALGGALSKALEAEMLELEGPERELEMARRFVRIAGSAAQQMAHARPGADPHALAQRAVATALREHVPAALAGQGGTWQRQGGRIVVRL